MTGRYWIDFFRLQTLDGMGISSFQGKAAVVEFKDGCFIRSVSGVPLLRMTAHHISSEDVEEVKQLEQYIRSRWYSYAGWAMIFHIISSSIRLCS